MVLGWVCLTERPLITGTDQPLSVRIGAKAKITARDAILLVKERHNDGSTFWTLPGGAIEPGEPEPIGLRRELQEELDCQVYVGPPTGEMWYAHQSIGGPVSSYTVYDCTIASKPSACAAEEVLECRWIDPDSFPPETLPQIRCLCRDNEESERTSKHGTEV